MHRIWKWIWLSYSVLRFTASDYLPFLTVGYAQNLKMNIALSFCSSIYSFWFSPFSNSQLCTEFENEYCSLILFFDLQLLITSLFYQSVMHRIWKWILLSHSVLRFTASDYLPFLTVSYAQNLKMNIALSFCSSIYGFWYFQTFFLLIIDI